MTQPFDQMHWDALGVPADADERTIKRAYAQRLKTTRPEDDPLKFQELRTAYEYALSVAAQPVTAAPHPMRQFEAAIDYEITPPLPPEPNNDALDPRKREFLIEQKKNLAIPVVDAENIAQEVWQAFVQACEKFAPLYASTGSMEPLGEALTLAKDQLTSTLKHQDLDALAVREAFKQTAIDYCIDDAALPLVRIACLEVLKWDEDRWLVNYYSTHEAQTAINLALADKQYEFLLVEAKSSAAAQELLHNPIPVIPWRKFYKAAFAADMRSCIANIRTARPELEHFRIGSHVVEAWLDAATRPWPTLITLIWAISIGLVLALVSAGLSSESTFLAGAPSVRGPVIITLCALLFIAPPLMLAGYPRYLYRPLQNTVARIRSDRRVHLGWWGAHVLVSSLAFGLNSLPSVFGFVFTILVCLLFVGDLILKRQINTGYFAFIFIMACLLTAPLTAALTPYMGPLAIYMVILLSGLFNSLRSIMFTMYGRDWYQPKVRAAVLGIGALLALIQYALAPHFPATAALIGWWWILVAAGAADLFLVSLLNKEEQHGAILWILGLAVLFYSSRAIQIKSPIEEMFHLQITLAIALVIGLLQNGRSYWKDRKNLKAKKNR